MIINKRQEGYRIGDTVYNQNEISGILKNDPMLFLSSVEVLSGTDSYEARQNFITAAAYLLKDKLHIEYLKAQSDSSYSHVDNAEDATHLTIRFNEIIMNPLIKVPKAVESESTSNSKSAESSRNNRTNSENKAHKQNFCYFSNCSSVGEAKRLFMAYTKIYHPDNKEYGDSRKFIEMKEEYERFCKQQH